MYNLGIPYGSENPTDSGFIGAVERQVVHLRDSKGVKVESKLLLL